MLFWDVCLAVDGSTYGLNHLADAAKFLPEICNQSPEEPLNQLLNKTKIFKPFLFPLLHRPLHCGVAVRVLMGPILGNSASNVELFVMALIVFSFYLFIFLCVGGGIFFFYIYDLICAGQ